jgi:hypothetical protein
MEQCLTIESRSLKTKKVSGSDILRTRNAYKILVGKPEGKRPLGRTRRRSVDNIKIDLREIDGMVWTGSIWLRIGTNGGLLLTR